MNKRRGAAVHRLVDVSASVAQQPGALEAPLVACHEKQRGAILIGLVDRRAGLEKQPGALEVVVLARDGQRRSAATASRRPDARAPSSSSRTASACP